MRLLLARAARFVRKNEVALRLARQYVARAPHSAAAWRIVGLCLGDLAVEREDCALKEQAVAALERAHVIDPSDRLVATNLVTFTAFWGDTERARQIAVGVGAHNPQLRDRLLRLLTHYEDG